MKNDFDMWNALKKHINADEEVLVRFPKESEIWVSIMGKNIGFEQNGVGDLFSRPVLVVKKFNNQMFWCVPLSTKQKPYDFYFNFVDQDNKNVSIILAQIKLMSIKRLTRKICDIDIQIFEQVKMKLKSFL